MSQRKPKYNRTTRKSPQRHDQKRNSGRSSYQSQAHHTYKHSNQQQVWVKKDLLRAQRDSMYKWVPKHLLQKPQIPEKQGTSQKTSHPRRRPRSRPTTQRWISKDVLTKQGYYEGACMIWVRKQTDSQSMSKEMKSIIQRKANDKTSLQYVPKAKKTVLGAEQMKESPKHRTAQPTIRRKATAQEKGKWIPKVVADNTISYEEQLPSSSQVSIVTKEKKIEEMVRPTPTTKDSNPLEVVRLLASILLKYDNKQVDSRWKQFMASKATKTTSSSSKALGPKLLQDPPLAPH